MGIVDKYNRVMKYVVTGMDLRLVGDIGNCTLVLFLLQNLLKELRIHVDIA